MPKLLDAKKPLGRPHEFNKIEALEKAMKLDASLVKSAEKNMSLSDLRSYLLKYPGLSK